MIYKICYALFAVTFMFGIGFDDDYKDSKVRTMQFIVICIGLCGQLIWGA